MYTNIEQHCNCQSQDNFSTLNITLNWIQYNMSFGAVEYDAQQTSVWHIATQGYPDLIFQNFLLELGDPVVFIVKLHQLWAPDIHHRRQSWVVATPLLVA